MTTFDKLPHVKTDIVRIDDEWGQWNIGDLIDNLGKWRKKNKPEEEDTATETTKKEKHWFSKKAGELLLQIK